MLEERQVERQFADASIGMALEYLRSSGEEPDNWESSELAGAIGAHFRGAYRLAEAAAEKSMTPKEQRSRTAAAVQVTKFSLAELEQAFVWVRAEPIRLSPHFGPIIFTGDGGKDEDDDKA